MARRPQSRPGVRLGVVAVIVVALYASMVGTGHTTPKLGLDLQGGTTVILTPRAVAGQSVNKGQLQTAVDIIRQRVNGLGVSEAQVVTQGTNVVVSVPGKGRGDVLNVVGQTASLTFRELANEANTNPPPGSTFKPTPSGSPPAPAPSGSVSPTAPASPTASVKPSVPVKSSARPAPKITPSPSSTAHGRALAGALAAASPSPAAPTNGTVSPHPATSPNPATSPTSPNSATSPNPATSPSAAGTGSAAPPNIVQSAAPGPAKSSPSTEKDQTVPTAAELASFRALDCAKNGGRPTTIDDNAHHFVVACDRNQPIKYLLKPAQILGTDVSTAQGTLDQNGPQGVSTGAWVVNLTFKDSAINKVENITGRLNNANHAPLAITLDGVVVSAPSTNGQLGKNVQISGGQPAFTQKESTNLANVLKYGSLPVPFDRSSVESISPTLGKDSLNAGLLAGGIGLILVLLYVFLYYRALGIVTVLSLAISGLMVYALVTLLGQLIGFTLSLAGIAGLIVSVGITADSFVVFFERLKDEIREGRSPRQAVQYGWIRARRTIYSADTVSFLAAVILYEVSVGAVAGFAFTLGLSTLLDLFTVLLFTKPLMTLLIRYRAFSSTRLSGLAPSSSGPSRRVTPREA